MQELVSSLQVKEKGYGFIVNTDELVIAHQDEGQKGQVLTEIVEGNYQLSSVINDVSNMVYFIPAY